MVLGSILNNIALGVPLSLEVIEVITTPTWGVGAWVVRPRLTRVTLGIIERPEP